MRIDQRPSRLIDMLRAEFHPKNRHVYLSDDLWIVSRRVAWETVISKYLALPGLVEFWPMSAGRYNGATRSITGLANQFHLTNNNGAQRGIYNDVVPYVQFNGTTQYLNYADDPQFDISGNEVDEVDGFRGLTLGGWFWLDLLGTTTSFISKFNNSAAGSYALRKNSSDVVLLSGRDAAGASFSHSSGFTLARGRWHHIAVSLLTSVSVTISVNGELSSTTSGVPGSIANSALEFRIGDRPAGGESLGGRAALCFVCAAGLSSKLMTWQFNQTKTFFGV
ncbi:MAG: LamG-like jellyroll fold domain-containing protein [Nitrospiria bacterium]